MFKVGSWEWYNFWLIFFFTHADILHVGQANSYEQPTQWIHAAQACNTGKNKVRGFAWKGLRSGIPAFWWPFVPHKKPLEDQNPLPNLPTNSHAMPACQFLLATNATRNGQVARGFLLLPQTWSKASTMPEAGRMPFSGLSQQRGASPKVMQNPSLQQVTNASNQPSMIFHGIKIINNPWSEPFRVRTIWGPVPAGHIWLWLSSCCDLLLSNAIEAQRRNDLWFPPGHQFWPRSKSEKSHD